MRTFFSLSFACTRTPIVPNIGGRGREGCSGSDGNRSRKRASLQTSRIRDQTEHAKRVENPVTFGGKGKLELAVRFFRVFVGAVKLKLG